MTATIPGTPVLEPGHPTPPEVADCWAPVPLPWRHVVDGEVFLGRGGALWSLVAKGGTVEQPAVTVVQVGRPDAAPMTVPVDPDDEVPVLVPTIERDTVRLTRLELGARIVARRAGA